MSNTPRTDQIMKFSFGDDREYVTVEFARKLESELTSMTQQRDALIMFLECEMNWSFFRAEYQLGENLIRALAERVIELQQWKDDAMKVQSSWDAQEVSTLLNMQLGSSILPQIEPAIRKLIKQRDELIQAIEGYDTTAVNDPKWQHRVNDAVDNCIKA